MRGGAGRGILDDMIPGLKRIDGELSLQQNLSAINPNLGMGDGYDNNCGNSTVAYELRRMGYDVEARPGFGMSTEELAGMFDGAIVRYASQLSTTDAVGEMIPKIERDILTWGEGARGAIRGEWASSSRGHVFSLEVRDGGVKYDDGQADKEDVKYLIGMKPQTVKYVRLDNTAPNEQVLKAVKNRGCSL